MTDPVNAISSLAGAAKDADEFAVQAAKSTASLWMKVLGPPAEALGGHFRSRIELWSEDRLARRVLEGAAKKTDTDRPGTVPPRVAADLFEKAQWAEDEFVAEYLSGVLASSRTEDGADDSGVSWTALVGRLSSSHLRLHYILYSTARHHLMGATIDLVRNLEDLSVVTPSIDLLAAFDSSDRAADGEFDPNVVHRFNEAMMNLVREGLISSHYALGRVDKVMTKKTFPVGHILRYRVSLAGIMLFYRGGGSRETRIRMFTDPSLDLVYADMDGVEVPVRGSARYDDIPDSDRS